MKEWRIDEHKQGSEYEWSFLSALESGCDVTSQVPAVAPLEL